jgi:hypothetical protein
LGPERFNMVKSNNSKRSRAMQSLSKS